MTPSSITILVTLFAVWVCVWGQNCDPQRLLQCKNFLGEKFNTGGFLATQTREDLKNLCRQLNGVITCVDGFIEECLKNHRNRQLINRPLLVMRAFEEEMCRVDSPVAEEYLRHAPCLLGAAPKVKHCSETTQYFPKDPRLSDGQSRQEVSKTDCCNVKSMVDCVLDGFEQECGAESMAFTRRNIELIIQPVKETMCGTDYESRCPSVTPSSNGSSTSGIGSRDVDVVGSCAAAVVVQPLGGFSLFAVLVTILRKAVLQN